MDNLISQLYELAPRFDEMELEAQHFFQEGFRAGRSLNQSQTPPLP